jgi:N-acetylmuramoyl-L-alanine amidase
MTATKLIITRASVFIPTALLVAVCVSSPRNGALVPRTSDEIVVAGQYIHTYTPVILWTDPGGYDA